MLVAVDGIGLHGRPGVGDHLFREAAVGCRERLPFALGGVHRFGERDALHSAGGLVGREQVADLALERDRERVFGDRRFVAAAGRRTVGEDGRVAQRGGARAGDAHGLAGHAVHLGGGQDVAAGEPPGAVDEDADAEPLALARGDALDAAGADGNALIEPADDPDIGVAGAQRRGGVEGAVGQVSHAPRSLAEGSATAYRSDAVVQRGSDGSLRGPGRRPRPGPSGTARG